MSEIMPYDSVSGYCYDNVIVPWRNQYFDKEGNPIEPNALGEPSFLRKLGTEAALVSSALLGIMEAVGRVAFSVLAIPFALLFGGKDKNSHNCFDHFVGLTLGGGIVSFMAAVSSAIGIVQNFREDELPPIRLIIKEYFNCIVKE